MGPLVAAKMTKDSSIDDLISALSAHFGAGAFDVVDHWEADLHAVGIARHDDHRVLAYVSTTAAPDDTYFVELELPTETGDEFPYSVAGRHHPPDLAGLVH